MYLGLQTVSDLNFDFFLYFFFDNLGEVESPIIFQDRGFFF